MAEQKLPDTPWHVGYAKKHEEDPRRHKSRCIHNKNKVCHCGKSKYYSSRCGGSAHCVYYSESQKSWSEKLQNLKTKEAIIQEENDQRAEEYRLLKMKQAQKVMNDPDERKKYTIYPNTLICPICHGDIKNKHCNYCGLNI